MAARFWRCVLGAELALALVIALSTSLYWHWPASAALLAAIGALAVLQYLLVASSFVVARACARDGSFGARPGLLLRTLMKEYFHFSVMQLRMCAEPYRHLRDVEFPPAGQAARPVLLLHGIACNRAVWRPVLERLRSAGFAPIRALDLEPLFPSIDSHTAQVQRALLALHSRSGGAEVAIIAHSMGGLVARTVLRSVSPGLIGRIVTIATPHHGTAIAGRLRLPAMIQMRPNSSWLRSLNAVQVSAGALTCIYSMEDNLIAPARSAALDGAQLHELRGLGHLELLQSRQVMDHVVAALNRGCPA